jgi:hypothetical protein
LIAQGEAASRPVDAPAGVSVSLVCDVLEVESEFGVLVKLITTAYVEETVTG